MSECMVSCKIWWDDGAISERRFLYKTRREARTGVHVFRQRCLRSEVILAFEWSIEAVIVLLRQLGPVLHGSQRCHSAPPHEL